MQINDETWEEKDDCSRSSIKAETRAININILISYLKAERI